MACHEIHMVDRLAKFKNYPTSYYGVWIFLEFVLIMIYLTADGTSGILKQIQYKLLALAGGLMIP